MCDCFSNSEKSNLISVGDKRNEVHNLSDEAIKKNVEVSLYRSPAEFIQLSPLIQQLRRRLSSWPCWRYCRSCCLQAAWLLTDSISDLISVRLCTRSDRRTRRKSVRMAPNLRGFSLIFSLMISLTIQLFLITLTSRSWCPSAPEGHRAACVSTPGVCWLTLC